MKTPSALLLTALLAAGCNSGDATNAVIDDGYPGPTDAGDATKAIAVYRGWWLVATFPAPVGGGAESGSERVVPGSDYAYMLLAPGWDPSSGSAPPLLLPAMSKDQLSVARGDTLHIQVDDAHVVGNCAAKQPLTQAQADFITQSIFPGPFAGMTYDAATCTATPVGDAGADAPAPDGGSDGSRAGDARAALDGGDAAASD